MRFVQPWYLLLLIPVVVGLWYSFRLVHGMARARKRLSFILRFLLLGAIICALAGPEAHRPNRGTCTIFLLDRSDSVSDLDRKKAEEFVSSAMEQLSTDDAAGVIAFAKDAKVDLMPGGRRSLPQVLTENERYATDVAGAVRLASATFPEGKARRIVVLSDGNQTTGDALEAAQVAATDHIQIDFVPLGADKKRAEVSVTDLETPQDVRVNQPFDIRIVADSSVEQNATLVLDRDGVVVKKEQVHLTEGRNALVVSDTLTKTGFPRYRATLLANSDEDNRNNVGMGFVAVRGRPRILILQQDTKDSSLANALKKQGIDADLGGPSMTPVRPEDLQPYDALIFNDINAASMSVSQMKLVQSAVRDSGIGFAMVGGEDSFLPGGYYGSPIADVLPVDLNIRQRKSFPSTSILILIDASGSMSLPEDGVTKLRLAAKAAEDTVNLMSNMDRVGVGGSADGIQLVAPMQKLTNKGAVTSQIRKLDNGGGGIYIYDSVVAAKKILEAEPSKVRHFILLADGSDSEKQEGSNEQVALMRSEKITTTVVAIGDGPDVPFLKKLAGIGGGRFYLAKKASQLPAIFTQDAAVMSRSAIEEGAFLPKIQPGDALLKGVADAGTPPLLAYCLTDSRPLSNVSMRTKKDDVLLSTWQYGLGTSLAFTSDAKARWASKWVTWEGFGTFWAQMVRGISRRATSNNYQASVQNQGAKGRVQIKGVDRLGNPLQNANVTVKLSLPDGSSKDLTLAQTGPGLFESDFDASMTGSYILTVAEPGPGGKDRVQSRGFSIAYPPEYRTYRVNKPLLERLGASTSGRELKSPDEALRPVANPGESIAELWSVFLLFAALMLPIDVGVRRIALPLGEILAKVWARLSLFFRRERSTAEQVATVGRLQQAKQRVKSESPPAQQKPAAKATNSAPKEPTPPAPSRPGTTTGSGSPASKLLESKRKRSEK